jgi:hypothetical protein
MLSKFDIAARLAAIEREIPTLRLDMDTFAREFEDRAERLCADVEPSDQTYVLDRLGAMLKRAGVNA